MDKKAMLKMLRKARSAQSKIYQDLRATTDSLGDIRSPETPFDYEKFLFWYEGIMRDAENGLDEVDQEGDYFRREIVFYMNRSISFVKDQHQYYALVWSPQDEQNKWEILTDKDMFQIFKNKQVIVPAYTRKLDKETDEYVVVDKSKKENLAQIYMESPNRRECHSICFKPGEGPIYNGMLNMWMGYRYPMSEIWAAATDFDAQCLVIKFLSELIYEILCKKSPILFTYWLDWWATKYRKPETKLQSTLISYSVDQRVGKGTAFNMLGHGLGQHYTTTSDKNDIAGRWTSVSKFKVVMFLDEALWAGDKAIHGVLKTKITETKSRHEEKYKNPYVGDNPCSYVQATNNLKLIPTDQTEMRYVICEASPSKAGDIEFYKKLEEDMFANNRAGIKCLMYFLLYGYRISPGFGKGHQIPHTHLLRIQKESSADSSVEFLRAVLDRRFHVHPRELTDNTDANLKRFQKEEETRLGGRSADKDDLWVTFVSWSDMKLAYTKFCELNSLRPDKKDYLKQRIVEFYGASQTMEVQKHKIQIYDRVEVDGGSSKAINMRTAYVRYWILPSYEHCSKAFCTKTGQAYVSSEMQVEAVDRDGILPHLEALPAMEKRNVVLVDDYDTPWQAVQRIKMENPYPRRDAFGRLPRNKLRELYKEQVVFRPDSLRSNRAMRNTDQIPAAGQSQEIEEEYESEDAMDEEDVVDEDELPLTPRNPPPAGWVEATAISPSKLLREEILDTDEIDEVFTNWSLADAVLTPGHN